MSKKPRNIPNWLVSETKFIQRTCFNQILFKNYFQKERKKNVDSALANIQKTKTREEVQPKRRLRSNYSFEEPAEEEDLVPVFNIESLEFVKYTGKIVYCTDFYSVAEACDEILKFVDQQEGGKVPLGFDMEWTFSFKTGPDKTSVIQICTTLEKCYVLQISSISKIPIGLTLLLHHDKVLLHGVNIKNDLRKLERDYPVFKSDIMISNCLDLGLLYNQVCSSSGRWSLERLAIQVVKLRIFKDRNVRMSKWHICPLTDDQKMYAAIDVYVRISRLSQFSFDSP